MGFSLWAAIFTFPAKKGGGMAKAAQSSKSDKITSRNKSLQFTLSKHEGSGTPKLG